jgi:hypothetical protein
LSGDRECLPPIDARNPRQRAGGLIVVEGTDFPDVIRRANGHMSRQREVLRLRDNRDNVTRRDFEVSAPIAQNGVPAVKSATVFTVTGGCQ